MIRRVKVPALDIETSAIGFGCASLGSRISRTDGLRALERAFDLGVSWYDVAPAYGAGEAEEILGTFLRTRRGQVAVCTKVGMAPPRGNHLLKSMYGLARPAMSVLGGLRRRFRRMSATRNRTVALDPTLIQSSLERSLKRLQTDHVDIFFLHSPAIESLARDDVRRALEDAVTSGKARHAGVAGTYDAALAVRPGDKLLDVMQFAAQPGESLAADLERRAARPVTIVNHSVFGVLGAMDQIKVRIAGDAAAVARLREAGYGGTAEEAASALLLDSALASNPDGVVLMSMFAPRHLASNAARAEGRVRPEAAALVKALLMNGEAAASR